VDAWWWRAIWQSTTSLLLNLRQLSGWVLDVWEAIGQRELEGAGGASGV
jgi:hypothetical protein